MPNIVLALGVLFSFYLHAGVRSSDLLDRLSPSQVPQGTRNILPALDGVLYRGGGPGLRRTLPDHSLKGLCEQGYSMAFYAYGASFKALKEVHCTDVSGKSNTLEYFNMSFGNSNHRRQYLEKIKEIAVSGKGPAYVHCWNGLHASGELTAIAFIQFCGWSGARAGQYWADVVRRIGDAKNLPKYTSIIRRIENFRKFDGIDVPPEISARICPL